MKCTHCGKDADRLNIVFGYGAGCSKDCIGALLATREALQNELRAEGLAKMPEALETHDFERWALKFAVIWIDSLGAAERAILAENNPIMLVAEHAADEFKGRMLHHIHRAYVSEVKFKGHARLFNDGEYCFRQPVPAEKIIDAARKAHLLAEA